MCDTAPAGRLPLLMLGPIVTAYEHAMTEGDGRNTWRTDRYSPCPRAEAPAYLTFLASLGYQLAGIEQAVASMTPYTGETRAGDPITGEPAEPAASKADAHSPVPGGEQDSDATGQMTATTASAQRWAPPISRIPMTAQASRGLTASRMPRDRQRRAPGPTTAGPTGSPGSGPT